VSGTARINELPPGQVRTICVLHLVPRVPLSSSGFWKYTQRESTYRRALTLSRALITPSKLSQNSSLNTFSVSGDTRFT
jgi:hypothetical protein